MVLTATLGLDANWKRRLSGHVPPRARSILVLDCGTGIVTMRLHRRAPRASLVGVDLTLEYPKRAGVRFADVPADATFLHAYAEAMAVDRTFDVVVSSYVPEYAHPQVLLGRRHDRVLSSGIIALHDFDHPREPLAYWCWRRLDPTRRWMGVMRTRGVSGAPQAGSSRPRPPLRYGRTEPFRVSLGS